MAPCRFKEETGTPITGHITEVVQIGEDGSVPDEGTDLIAASVAVLWSATRSTMLKTASSGIPKYLHQRSHLEAVVDMCLEGGGIYVMISDPAIQGDYL
jgi:hypothetical protein